MFEILAQTATAVEETTIKDLLSIGGPLGVGGVLIWYLWYRTSVTDPKLMEEHRKERKEATEHFTLTLDKIATRFDESLNAERLHREREAEANRDRFRCPAVNSMNPNPRT